MDANSDIREMVIIVDCGSSNVSISALFGSQRGKYNKIKICMRRTILGSSLFYVTFAFMFRVDCIVRLMIMAL